MTVTGETKLWIGGDAAELGALLDWLRHEDALRGRVRLRRAEPRPGEMGGVLDALVVAMGSGGAGAVLARSVSTWFSHRRSEVKLTVTAADGRKIELDARRVADVAALVRDVERLLEPGDRSP
ncbi:hypothetical protein [Amycolatopsis sp. NPDC059020]|uniref:effector-associated constant component EACC1 n=1 Tax=unclassified Amycolatopsis TaxID=2618356 RepID=UPI003671722F